MDFGYFVLLRMLVQTTGQGIISTSLLTSARKTARKIAGDSNSRSLRFNFEKTWGVIAIPTHIDVTHSNVYKPANPSEESLEGYEMVTDVWIAGSFVDAELLPEDDAP